MSAYLEALEAIRGSRDEWAKTPISKDLGNSKELKEERVPCTESRCKDGQYMGIRYARTCLRCKGTGSISVSAQKRYEDSRLLEDRRTWKDYEEVNKKFKFILV